MVVVVVVVISQIIVSIRITDVVPSSHNVQHKV